MEIFKQLKELGYKHYVDLTIEELDALPIDNIEKRIEYSLAIDWFRNNHSTHIEITPIWINSAIGLSTITGYSFYCNNHYYTEYQTYEEAREQAILKAIELCQKEK